MFDELIRRWWIIAARGVVAVALGIAALMSPDATLAFLMSMFGMFAIADGIFAMGAGLSVNWLPLFLQGVVGGAIGIFTVLYPPAATFWFVPLLVAWALVTGALELLGAVRLMKLTHAATSPGQWLLAAAGILTLLFGLLLMAGMAPTTAQLITIVGAYALASGALLLLFAAHLRTWRRRLPPEMTAAA